MDNGIAASVGDIDERKSLTDGPVLHSTPSSVRDDIEVSSLVNRNERVSALLTLLEQDIHAADIKWSLFIAACQHYRWDSCVKPFPPDYIKDGVKDIDSLLEVVDSLSSLTLLRSYLQCDDTALTNQEIIELAYWVLIRSKDIQISSVLKKNYDSVLNQVQSDTFAQRPNWIFQLTTKSNEVMWTQLTADHKQPMFGYHGSRLENFHSILHHGLQQHLNKNSLFGQGVYLSSELSVSLPYSPSGYSWGGSLLGSQLSCVALCEMVDHPDVKCQSKDSSSRAISKDSVGGEVPQKYYVVRNSDLVRVRYLLVYSSKTQPAPVHQARWWLLDWIMDHKLLVFSFAYVLLLTSIGLSGNIQIKRFYKMMIKKWFH